MTEAVALCRLDEIPDGGSNGFVAERPSGGRVGVIAVRRGDAVFLYENVCPHIGAPLDFTPGRFLCPEGTHILCSTHGAKFRIDDGFCIEGPCAGDTLTPLAGEVRDGTVWLTP